jgi:UDP-glucuronate 4-epimerase
MTIKRILITGAAGFIGYHLANFLKKEDIFVTGLDNFNDYYPKKLKEDRALALQNLGVSITVGDICDAGRIDELIRKHDITHIVHLAAQAGVRYSLTHPEVYIKANIEGFLQVLEACKRAPSVKLIYASSSSVYGRNKKIPFAVSDPTDLPANMYGVTKKTKELMASTYHHLYNIPVVGLRFFTVYGPWGRPDMAYYSFTKKILKSEPIDLYNFGDMRRDFTYIDDIIDGVVKCLDLPNGCDIFNLGNNKPESLHTLVELIEKETGKKAKINLLPMPEGEIIETYADIEESKKVLGFYPKTSLAEGIGKFVHWYRQYH